MADTSNTSASGGPIQFISGTIPYDDELVDILQPLFVALSGIPADMVRPRWQLNPQANQPEATETWAALGQTTDKTDWAPAIYHDPAGNQGTGADIMQRSEEITLLFSVYGPQAKSVARRTADLLFVEQNRVLLQQNSMDLVTVGDSVMVPSLLHGVFQRRCDISITLRRNVLQTLGVLSLVSLADATATGINNELYITDIFLPP